MLEYRVAFHLPRGEDRMVVAEVLDFREWSASGCSRLQMLCISAPSSLGSSSAKIWRNRFSGFPPGGQEFELRFWDLVWQGRVHPELTEGLTQGIPSSSRPADRGGEQWTHPQGL